MTASIRPLVILIVATTIVVSFQNCQSFESTEISASLSGTEELPPEVEFVESISVDPKGDDAYDGQGTASVKSLHRAQLLVRERLKAGLRGNLRVSIAAGEYTLSAPLILGPEDSSDKFVVEWRGADSEAGKTLISGGHKIEKNAWTLVTADSNIYRARVSGASIRQLYSGSEQLIRARSPNVADMGRVGSESAPRVAAWLDNQYYQLQIENAPTLPAAENGFAVELVAPMGWAVSRFPLLATAKSGTMTYFSPKASAGGINPGWIESLKAPGSGVENSFGPFHLGEQKVYFEGDLSFVDIDNEWAYDRAGGWLYLKVGDTSLLDNIWYPKQEQLLAVKGAQNLSFRNISWGHSQWNKPSDGGYIGFHGTGYYKTKDAAGNLSIESQPAAIFFEDTINLSLTDNQFFGLGSSGLKIKSSKNTLVRKNQFSHISGTALVLADNDKLSVYQNKFEEIGLELAGDAIQLIDNRSTLVANNDIRWIAGRAIYALSNIYGAGVSIQANTIKDVTALITDAGAINTGGQFTVRENRIERVLPSGWNLDGGKNTGVYSDVFSYHSLIEANRFTNVQVGINRNCDAGSIVTANRYDHVETEFRETYAYCEPLLHLRPATDPWRLAIEAILASL